jgi:type II secretory pathway component PulM
MKLTPRDRKFLIAGGAAIALVAVFYAVTTLIPSREELSKEVELKKRLVIKQRELLAQEATHKSRLERYRTRLEKDRTRLLTGSTPAMAAAELQSMLSDLAAQNGVEISRKTARPEQKVQDNLVKVAVQMETNCGPDQLVQLLSAIENYNKFLTVDELGITSYRIQKKLEIHPLITVAGYFSAPEVKADKASSGR